MKELVARANDIQKSMVKWRRHIHKNPEVGLDTQNTAAYIKAELETMGYEVKYVAGTGVSALAGGRKPGKCFLIRADIDALPVREDDVV